MYIIYYYFLCTYIVDPCDVILCARQPALHHTDKLKCVDLTTRSAPRRNFLRTLSDSTYLLCVLTTFRYFVI